MWQVRLDMFFVVFTVDSFWGLAESALVSLCKEGPEEDVQKQKGRVEIQEAAVAKEW